MNRRNFFAGLTAVAGAVLGSMGLARAAKPKAVVRKLTPQNAVVSGRMSRAWFEHYGQCMAHVLSELVRAFERGLNEAVPETKHDDPATRFLALPMWAWSEVVTEQGYPGIRLDHEARTLWLVITEGGAATWDGRIAYLYYACSEQALCNWELATETTILLDAE